MPALPRSRGARPPDPRSRDERPADPRSSSRGPRDAWDAPWGWGASGPWGSGLRTAPRTPPWVLAVVLSAVMVLGSLAESRQDPGRVGIGASGSGLVGTALLAVAGLALAARLRAPVPTLGVVGAATATYVGLGFAYGPAAFLALVVATVGAVVRGHRPAAYAVLGAAFVGGSVLTSVRRGYVDAGGLLQHALWVVALVGVAELVRSRAERFEAARRVRTEAGRRRASEERLLLARELHDVLAHSVSLINVQASTALHLFDEDPERARAALGAIKLASREALEELRGTVRALRAEGEEAPRAPAAGLADIDDLAAQTTAVGPAVVVLRTGEARPVPPRIELAAYRIVQEALTNVRRHADASRVEVVLDAGPDALRVEVVDDGPGHGTVPASGRSTGPGSDDGHGLQGMRERVAALGGTLQAGPGSAGGYAVRALLPLPDSRGTEATG